MSSANSGGRSLAVAVWTLAVIIVLLAFSREWFPALASDHGAGVDRMIRFTMLTSGILILAGHAILGFMLWRFGGRAHASAIMPPERTQRRWSLAAAVTMALIAEGGVLALGFPVWNQYFGTTAPTSALTIEVTAEQFAWNVRYAGPDGVFGRTAPKLITLDNPLGLDPADPQGADDIVGLNVIHAVAGRPLRVRLRSKDVIHSFFLPNLRVKQDAVPGLTVEFWFMPSRQGRFELACSQLCGFGHYEMKGLLIVQSAEEFARWSAEQSRG
jgi:cytochrome c oxidase subunit II